MDQELAVAVAYAPGGRCVCTYQAAALFWHEMTVIMNHDVTSAIRDNFNRQLRSANKNLLAVPSCRTILADRAFSQNPFISAGPRHIIRKSAPLNLVLVPRIMPLYKFTYLLRCAFTVLEEHCDQISSRSDLKRRSLGLV